MQWREGIRSRMGTTWRLLLKELGAFGVVGAVCFALDVLLFQLLYAHVGLGALTAKSLAALASMTAAYIGHRQWSFSHRARADLRRQYLLFAAVNGVTLLLNLGIVALVRYPLGLDGAMILQLANIAGIAIGTVIRYLCYRRWVFPAVSPTPAGDPAPVTTTPLAGP